VSEEAKVCLDSVIQHLLLTIPSLFPVSFGGLLFIEKDVGNSQPGPSRKEYVPVGNR